jgi:hypothetical protein
MKILLVLSLALLSTASAAGSGAHAPTYEKVDEFNQTTLEFLRRQSG